MVTKERRISPDERYRYGWCCDHDFETGQYRTGDCIGRTRNADVVEREATARGFAAGVQACIDEVNKIAARWANGGQVRNIKAAQYIASELSGITEAQVGEDADFRCPTCQKAVRSVYEADSETIMCPECTNVFDVPPGYVIPATPSDGTLVDDQSSER